MKGNSVKTNIPCENDICYDQPTYGRDCTRAM